MKKEIRKNWAHASPTLYEMTKVEASPEFFQLEQAEVMSHLPSFQGAKVLELAAGMGRYTPLLAKQASEVTTVDIAPQLIEASKAANSNFNNIEYITSDAMDLSFKNETFDLIFINWLFMYLDDDESSLLMRRIFSWLKKSGYFFFRETTHPISSYVKGDYAGYYRSVDAYTTLATSHFSITKQDIILTYFLQCKYNNQHFWLCQKQK